MESLSSLYILYPKLIRTSNNLSFSFHIFAHLNYYHCCSLTDEDEADLSLEQCKVWEERLDQCRRYLQVSQKPDTFFTTPATFLLWRQGFSKNSPVWLLGLAYHRKLVVGPSDSESGSPVGNKVRSFISQPLKSIAVPLPQIYGLIGPPKSA